MSTGILEHFGELLKQQLQPHASQAPSMSTVRPEASQSRQRAPSPPAPPLATTEVCRGTESMGETSLSGFEQSSLLCSWRPIVTMSMQSILPHVSEFTPVSWHRGHAPRWWQFCTESRGARAAPRRDRSLPPHYKQLQGERAGSIHGGRTESTLGGWKRMLKSHN